MIKCLYNEKLNFVLDLRISHQLCSKEIMTHVKKTVFYVRIMCLIDTRDR